tara:strand:+ start:392 stop:1462 length:1071 start_codon:yes stop_codon:yes gene_type:complete
MSELVTSAIKKFKNNFTALISLYFIVFVAFIAVFAYALAPDSSNNANQMHLSIHSKPPGFKVLMIIQKEEFTKNQSIFNKFFFGNRNPDKEIPILNYRVVNNKIFYKVYNSSKINEQEEFIYLSPKKPVFVTEKTFLLGTDKFGRDFLSRIIVGSRISFFIGFVAVSISLLLGLFLGSLSGYFGGKIDSLIMWLINVTWSIPTLLLVIAITLALGKGFWQVFIAVGLTMWVEVARVVRGEVMNIKEKQYITAAKALGFTDSRIILRHILPNIMAPVIVISAANFAGAILIESGLSFLGIGAQPPISSWGAMIKAHYNDIILGKAYLAVIPGICIMSLVMAFMLIGNSLRDVLDVKS